MKSGPDQFRDWMFRRRFLQKEAGEYLGFAESVVSKFLSGDVTPGLDNAVHIEELTGIPVRAWASKRNDKSSKGTRKAARIDEGVKAHAG